MDDSSKKWDVFISHASEDKDSFVRPLAIALQRLGVSVWYDKFKTDFAARATGTSANMTKTVFAGMETVQSPMGRSAQIRTNSTDGGLRWLLWGRERPQGAVMTAKSVLNSSVCVSTILNNVPVVVTGIHMGNFR